MPERPALPCAESRHATIDLDAAVQVIADALCDNNWHLPPDDARDIALVALDEIQRRSKEAT